MPPFDRETALKNAEKAIKLGKIDAAIAEYVKVVEAQPRDWNTANALGDLYVRAKQVDKGVQQYTRIAENLAEEGFYPKAAALFKKILKIKPEDEYSMLQSGDLAAKTGKFVDAKQYYNQVMERRKKRGDKKGATEIAIRLGTLDPEDFDARMGAARLAVENGDTLTALREFKDVAARLEKLEKYDDAMVPLQAAYELDKSDDKLRGRLFSAFLGTDPGEARPLARGAEDLKQLADAFRKAGRHDAALEVLGEISAADPANLEIKANLAQAHIARGELDKAKAFLSAETAGDNPTLWLMLAEIELRANRLTEGKAAVVEAIKLDRTQTQQAVVLGCKLAEVDPEAAYQPIDAVADTALAESDFAAAAVALQEFTSRVPAHLVALMRLVEICLDGGLESAMYEAQAQLAEAYLAGGRAVEARIISEDLVAREPWNKANLDRFRRALVALGENDPDAIIADRLSGESPFLATEKMDLNEGVSFETPVTETPAAPVAEAAPADGIEIDLDALSEPEEAPAAPLPLTPPPPRSLDQAFKSMRDEAGRGSTEEAAVEAYRLALTYQEMNMPDDAIKALEQAARSPRQRFDAASMLGRVYLQRNDTVHAIEWLERAAEAPAPTPDAGRALLYDLAQALESVGEHARALAVFVELESESGGYRDVAGQIERLSKAQARG
ncbi:MAG TPA: tetratricopeptide repeat protein [Vicinamibacterales bacterium]|nr:tetratricopeptide repeat protein [Vicinamibacterales bacterium]